MSEPSWSADCRRGAATAQPSRRSGIALEQSPLLKKDKAGKDARLLSNMQVDFPIQGGGTFSGKLTIARFDIDPETRQLYVDGLLSGRAMKADGGIMKTPMASPS